MNRWLLLVIFATPAALAADPGGEWEGFIKLPAVELQFEVELEKGDEWSGKISIPTQNLSGFELGDVAVDGNKVRFTMKGIPGEPKFAGELSEDGDSIEGVFAQGAAFLKFHLKRKPPPKEISLPERLERLTEQLELRRVEFGIPGMAIAVVKDGEVILSRGFGVSDIEEETPVSEETLFAVGSTTKAFTATAIGMLVDDGKMDWDDPITRHLPGFRLPIDSAEAFAELTVRDLLCHRSGFARMGLLWASGKAGRDEILETAVKAKPLSPFREAFHYCNVTYLAAGQAGAAAAQTDWDTLIAQRIFEPLGMSSSTTRYADAHTDERMSRGYSATEDNRLLPMRNLDSIGPAGSINSNVLDMARWIQFQLAGGEFEGKRLISEEQFEETHTRQIDMGTGTGYGLGWMLRSVAGERLVEHGGNIDGFGAQVGLFPDDDLGFVLLTNVSATPLQSLSNRLVAESILGEWAEEAFDPDAEKKYAPYVGDYLANFGAFKDSTFTVQIKNGLLAVDVPGQTIYELHPPNAEGKWVFAVSDAIAVSFDREGDDEGPVVAMNMYQGGVKFELLRKGVQRKPEVDLEEVRKYLGNYRFDDTLDFEILVDGGRLTLDIPGRLRSGLRLPGDDGRWAVRAVEGHAIEFNLADDGKVEGLTIFREGEEPQGLPRIDGSEPGEDAELPSVEDILALREAPGRGKAFEAIETMRKTSRVRFVNGGAMATITVHLSRPGRVRHDLDVGRFGVESHIIDGDRGRVESEFRASHDLTGRLLHQARLQSGAPLQGDWSRHFDEIRVLRTEKVDGRPAHVIELTAGEFPPQIVHIDAENGDLLKIQLRVAANDSAMEIPVTTTFEDHREENGVRMPWRRTASNDQTGRAIEELQKIEVGIEVAPELFKLP